MHWTANLIPLAPFIMVIAIVGFVTMAGRAKDRHRAELQKDLLAKFSTAQEMSEFMKSDAGKLFLPEPTRVRTPAHRIGAGILVTIIGFGLGLSAYWVRSDISVHENLRVAGVIVMTVGIGLLISGFVTHLLARKWKESDPKPQ